MFTKTLAKLAEVKGAKIIYGLAIEINYDNDGKSVASVAYKSEGSSMELAATDIILAAGPWSPRLFPSIQLGAPRGHSIVLRPSGDLSPYVLVPTIEPPEDGRLKDLLSPELYPRPGDALHDFSTLYACGPHEYPPLPDTTADVEVDHHKCDDIRTAIDSVSRILRDGEEVTRQACFRPQIRPHEEGEEVGPVVALCLAFRDSGWLQGTTNGAFKIRRAREW